VEVYWPCVNNKLAVFVPSGWLYIVLVEMPLDLKVPNSNGMRLLTKFSCNHVVQEFRQVFVIDR
jgi:hypothetical protein